MLMTQAMKRKQMVEGDNKIETTGGGSLELNVSPLLLFIPFTSLCSLYYRTHSVNKMRPNYAKSGRMMGQLILNRKFLDQFFVGSILWVVCFHPNSFNDIIIL